MRPPGPIEASASARIAGSESIEDRRARIIALFGGAGAAGKTTTAVNLLTVLGVSRRAVLVDLDTTGASVAAHLRAVQPAWNILDVALKAPRSPEAWSQILDHRLQRIGSFSQGARVLCGIGRPRERSALTGAFVESLIAHLAERFDHVLLDLGDEPLVRYQHRVDGRRRGADSRRARPVGCRARSRKRAPRADGQGRSRGSTRSRAHLVGAQSLRSR